MSEQPERPSGEIPTFEGQIVFTGDFDSEDEPTPVHEHDE